MKSYFNKKRNTFTYTHLRCAKILHFAKVVKKIKLVIYKKAISDREKLIAESALKNKSEKDKITIKINVKIVEGQGRVTFVH